MNKLLFIAILLIPFFAIGMKIEGDIVYLFFLIFLIFFSKKQKIGGEYFVLAGLLLLVTCSFLMAIDEALAQKLSSWVFLFLLSGAVLLFKQNLDFKDKEKLK